MLYAIINGVLIARQEPLDLYIEIFRIVSYMAESTTLFDIWFSHIPCSACVQYMEMIFGSFTIKPTLYIESLRYNETSDMALRDLGCMAKLADYNYHLADWDWELFSVKYRHRCDYYFTTKHDEEYSNLKVYTQRLLNFLEGEFNKSSLAELCDM